MRLEHWKWKKVQPLAGNYIDDYEKVRELYTYDPQDIGSWERRAAELDRREGARVDRSALADALGAYNRRAGAPAAVQSNIERLRQLDSVVVSGGQQAGLFTGPLYVIHKAVTVLQAAREAERRLERPAIPVFWIAGEDHDWDEVNHMYYLTDAAREPRVDRIRVASSVPLPRTAVSRLPLEAEKWQDALQRLLSTLPDSKFKGELNTKLGDLLCTGESLTLPDAFARIMTWLFGHHGLVLLDADDPAIRRLEAPMFERIVKQNVELNAAIQQDDQTVRQVGYTPQAEVADDAANLFIFEGEERVLLRRDGNIFTDKKKARTYTMDQLVEIARKSPERLSNNVFTRPLMQDYLMPVLTTVLGSAEIAYWSLTKSAFALMDMDMPILLPRLEFTIVDGTVDKYMQKHELTFEDVVYRFADRKSAWLDRQDTVRFHERFAAVRKRIEEEYQELIGITTEINNGLRDLGDNNLDKITAQVDYYERKTEEAFRMKHDVALRQLARIENSVIPFAKPQERVHNVFAYLNQFGRGWIDYLVTSALPLDGEHRILYV
ncbi:bacillithiol biosynthesis cysteine-adding enzyme BshC [Paenibacillus sp. N1-5-1-14]|uniref:bacillithiol biosynthesis cysteine-adding enzyme BshC n=1 Tax=Paenibacillus radicibacter TaxID=2972488 RepID=UPI0021594B6D|nr:bacillithiol biosynthesis cysteine-adding enzyme BshC [Paenibacillus radicibacter]MCR8641929.1 bacillithiol biosynthesis cysteine-adding enzyme BshC [Paenibacillus radicibacter]